MDLEKLIQVGAFSQDYVEKSVEWGNNEFTVKIKKEMSPSDFEFIYLLSRGDDDSTMARRVSRSVLIDGQRISYDVAKKLKHKLLLAMCEAINSVQGVIGEEKKN